MNFVRIVHSDPDIAPAVVSERAAVAYAARGWQLEELVSDPTPVAAEPRELKRPQQNDSTAAWRTYAVALGAERGGITVSEAFDASRDDLVKKYAEPKPRPTPAATKRTPRKRAAAAAAPAPKNTPSAAPAKPEIKEN